MKNKIIISLIIVVVLILSVIFLIPEKKIIPANFSLSNKTGFDLAPGILSFGQITPNGSASRSITIDNLQNQKVKIEIKVKGEISNNIIASESNFYLQPNESKTITFTVFPDGLTTFKKYTGEVIIFTRKY